MPKISLEFTDDEFSALKSEADATNVDVAKFAHDTVASRLNIANNLSVDEFNAALVNIALTVSHLRPGERFNLPDLLSEKDWWQRTSAFDKRNLGKQFKNLILSSGLAIHEKTNSANLSFYIRSIDDSST